MTSISKSLDSKFSENATYNALLQNNMEYFENLGREQWKEWIARRLMGLDTFSVPGSSSSSDIPCAVFFSLYRRVNDHSREKILHSVEELVASMTNSEGQEWIGNSGKWLLTLAASIGTSDPLILHNVFQMAREHRFVSLGYDNDEKNNSESDRRDIHYYLLMFLSGVDPNFAAKSGNIQLKFFWRNETEQDPVRYGMISFMGLAKKSLIEALELIPIIVSADRNDRHSEDIESQILSFCHITLHDQPTQVISRALRFLPNIKLEYSLEQKLTVEMREALQSSHQSEY